MTFATILFPGAWDGPGEPDEPEFFADLNLGQVVAEITLPFAEYDLTPYFRVPLTSLDAVAYRQEVLRDLADPAIGGPVRAFAAGMRAVRERLALSARLHYPHQGQRWHLDAAAAYCAAVRGLDEDLRAAAPRSRGVLGLRAHVAAYAAAPAFEELEAEAARIGELLAGIAYELHIRGSRITVRRHRDEPDYSAEVTATFAKFAQGQPKDYRVAFTEPAEMNHVEAGVLALVARLHPEVFGPLAEFCERHRDFTDPVLARFDREVHFYLAHLDWVWRLEEAGLEFCYPRVSRSKHVLARATFDAALAGKLAARGSPVVRNDLHLDGDERILVVTGPNQGGKTTLARAFGQLHYLASLGCMVPGREAALLLPDAIFTHFEKQEALADLSGKLGDDLLRVRGILSRATGDSVIIMNEIFTSTTLADALFLARNILREIIAIGAIGVFVTFLDEIASLGPQTVSMVAAVDPDDPARRTYQVIRRPADGLAHAMALAARHGLTYRQIKERMAP